MPRRQPGHIAHAYGTAIAVSQNDIVERFCIYDLVIGRNNEADVVGIKRALGRIGGGADDRRSDLFEGQAGGGKFCRVHLNPY